MESHHPSSSGNNQLRGACYLCSSHGIEAKQRSHICPFATCECSNCKVIRVRRAVVARQLRMRREEKKSSDRSLRSYTCNRCRNHGLQVPKKGHKNACPFDSCSCPMCTLCHSRSILDSKFRRNSGKHAGVASLSPASASMEEDEVAARSQSVSPVISTPFSSPFYTPSLPSSFSAFSNPFMVTPQLIARIPSGTVSFPNSFDSENICPNEQRRVRFLLQSLPQSLQVLIGYNHQF